jgi:hypothetical protein
MSGRKPPAKMSVYKWYKVFDQNGCNYKIKTPGNKEKFVNILSA